MNRLIFAIMFAIALALSFVRVTGSNMSMTDDFQPETQVTAPTSWLSKVMHIFGEYKPVAGTVTLADTTGTVKPKPKKNAGIQSPGTPQSVTVTGNQSDLDPSTTCLADGSNCYNSSNDPNGFKVSAIVGKDKSDPSKTVAEVTLTDPGCPTCQAIVKDQTLTSNNDVKTQVTNIMNDLVSQARKAKDNSTVNLTDDSSDGKHKKKKDDDDVSQDKEDAQIQVDTCKAKKVVQYKTDSKDHDAGDWGTSGKYTDADSYNRCLQKMAKKFKRCMENAANDDDCNSVDGLDADSVAEVSQKLATALPQAFEACLAAGDSCDRDVWSKWQEDNPAQAIIAAREYMTSQYGNGIYNQAQQLAKMGPQGEMAAYTLLANNAQKIMNDPNALAHYQNDVMTYNTIRANYANNKPDSDDPHAAMANLAFSSTPQVYNPSDLSSAYTNLMGTVQKNALKQGYDLTTGQAVAVGQTQSALAGNSGLSPQIIQAVQAAGMKIVVCDTNNGVLDGRDCTDRGNSLYGTGALGGITPSSDPTNIGLAAFRLGQQNAALNTGLNAGLVNGTSIPAPSTQGLPWASNNGLSNTGLSTTPTLLQQNPLNMTTGRVSGLRQVGS